MKLLTGVSKQANAQICGNIDLTRAWFEGENVRGVDTIPNPVLGSAIQNQMDVYSEAWELLLVEALVDLRHSLGPFYIHIGRNHC